MIGIRAKPSIFAIRGIFLAGSAMAAEPDVLTVLELIENGRELYGQVVRVRGQFDNCGSPLCALCPEEATPDIYRLESVYSKEDGTPEIYSFRDCAALTFFVDSDSPRIGWRVNDLEREKYRFAVVTIEAEFSFDCLRGSGLTCTGTPSNLRDASVLEVHSRHNVLDGLNSHDYGGRLEPAIGQERDAMFEAFAAAHC